MEPRIIFGRDEHGNEVTPMGVDFGAPFTLGQLVLASHVPETMMFKVRTDGKIGQMLQYQGTWPKRRHGATEPGLINNYAHFIPYIRQGPGVWVLSKTEQVSVPLSKEELLSLYQFYAL